MERIGGSGGDEVQIDEHSVEASKSGWVYFIGPGIVTIEKR